MQFRILAVSAVACALLLPTVTACGGSGQDGNTITVAYERATNASNRVTDKRLARMVQEFEKANPGKKVTLIPIQASENDYYTKLELMMRSPRTAPDVVYEDTFLINSHIKAGYLRPIDDYVSHWDTWNLYVPGAKAGVKAQNGRTYGVPDGTDTRGIWYNKHVFAQAGLPTDWHPKTWDDLLTAARQIKAKLSGVTPMYLTTGKANGEATSMQGFEMLLYGTPSQLYNQQQKKWVIGSPGFRDSLQFAHTVYGEGLGPNAAVAMDENIDTRIYSDWFPSDRLGFVIDGSWQSGDWLPTGPHPWPQWSQTIGWAAMPTQHGQAPGKVSLAGGWCWSVARNGRHSADGFKFIQFLQTERNVVTKYVEDQSISVRQDANADPRYLNTSPATKFFTELVQYSFNRPPLPEYPKVSAAIQDAMETVTTSTGADVVDQAAHTYDDEVRDLAGAPENVTFEPGPKAH